MSAQTEHIMSTTATTTEWVCEDCYLTLAGFAAHEMGLKVAEPYAHDTDIVSVTNGSDYRECDACELSGYNDEERREKHADEEHDTDHVYQGGCDSCDQWRGMYMQAYAVTVKRRVWDDDAPIFQGATPHGVAADWPSA